MILILLIFYIFFLILCYSNNRDLHSFPTRRSSDLFDDPSSVRGRRGLRPPARSVSAVRGLRILPGGRHADILRSEEHTSELQSRRDIVCRLLLEKKNYSII